MDFKDYFKGKKITQMGLGLLGRGVGDAAFLADCGADLTITDLKTEKELAPSLERLKDVCGIPNSTAAAEFGIPQTKVKFVLGEHRLEDFRNRDFILKAAGVPLDSAYIAEARKNKIPIEMDASLFLKLAPRICFIGVTGTRGKSTTAVLIYEIIKKAISVREPDTFGREVYLAGNIKDTATLPLLRKVRDGDFVVAELDSWQLQGFGTAEISPQVAVFTTFYPDHLNYYGGSPSRPELTRAGMEKYFDDKANIFKYQKNGDFLIVGEQATERVLKASPPLVPVIARAADLPKSWKLKIIGGHNRANAVCAIAAARAVGINDYIIRKVVREYAGVAGRLQFLKDVNGVRIYNDTTATTPEATIAALRALREESKIMILEPRNIILIMGGSDKGLNMSKLVEEIPRYCKAVVLLPGTGTAKIENEKIKIENDNAKLKIIEAEDLKEAVEEAMKVAKRGDIILFSPAFASFGMFANEYDRGERFVDEIKKL